ncbi:MAG: class I SAM-dependent methyltransferase [Cyanobacteria bacterium J06648_11]
MGWYARAILPNLLDRVMAANIFTEQRRSLLANVSGRVLEIGFGTGLNLPHYAPARVQTLVAIDKNPGMNALVSRRIARSHLCVEHHVLNGETLPFANHEFDCAVSTWTLCSIQDIDRAIAEIYRVLKPGGQFYFLEHGLSSNPNVQTWQHRLTPVQKILADGCHLDRDIVSVIARHPLAIQHLECFSITGLPEVVGYTYCGCALKRMS